MVDPRFMRTELLLGKEGIENIESARVAVVGLGAVGGYALEALARAGVKNFVLIDFDTVEVSNINRQILALSSTIGQKKTEVAKKRVSDINPNCHVEVKDAFAQASNFDQLFEGRIDFVVDAIDSIKEKTDMMLWLLKKNIAFVSAMGAALKTDISCLKISKLSQTCYCPMAKKIRSVLKKAKADLDSVMCVYCAQQQNDKEKPIIFSDNGKKAVLGSMSTITAVMGLMLAHYVILSLAKGVKNAKYA